MFQHVSVGFTQFSIVFHVFFMKVSSASGSISTSSKSSVPATRFLLVEFCFPGPWSTASSNSGFPMGTVPCANRLAALACLGGDSLLKGGVLGRSFLCGVTGPSDFDCWLSLGILAGGISCCKPMQLNTFCQLGSSLTLSHSCFNSSVGICWNCFFDWQSVGVNQ